MVTMICNGWPNYIPQPAYLDPLSPGCDFDKVNERIVEGMTSSDMNIYLVDDLYDFDKKIMLKIINVDVKAEDVVSALELDHWIDRHPDWT